MLPLWKKLLISAGLIWFWLVVVMVAGTMFLNAIGVNNDWRYQVPQIPLVPGFNQNLPDTEPWLTDPDDWYSPGTTHPATTLGTTESGDRA